MNDYCIVINDYWRGRKPCSLMKLFYISLCLLVICIVCLWALQSPVSVSKFTACELADAEKAQIVSSDDRKATVVHEKSMAEVGTKAFIFGEQCVTVVDPNSLIDVVQDFAGVLGENAYFGRVLGESCERAWVTIVVGGDDPQVYQDTGQIGSIGVEGTQLKLRLYSIEEYTSAAVNNERLLVFRQNKNYYDVYSLPEAAHTDRIPVQGLADYYVYDASFNTSADEALLIGGGSKKSLFTAVIHKNSLDVLAKGDCSAVWGSDNYVYFYSGLELLRYNPAKKTTEPVMTGSVFVLPGMYSKLTTSNEIVFYDFTYSFIWSRKTLQFKQLRLNVSTMKYQLIDTGVGREQK